MIRLQGFRPVFRLAMGRRGLSKDIDEEIEFHLASRTEELAREGVDLRAARDIAVQEFGDVRRIRRELRGSGRRRARRTRGTEMLEAARQDIGFAVRQLWRSKGFTTAALLTLGVGIGANVAMFSVANLALFRALPFPDADRLVAGRTAWPGGGIGWTVSAPDYYDIRDEVAAFEATSAITPFSRDFTITGEGEPERVPGVWISPGLFRTLGVSPLLGREFLPEEGEPGGPRVVMMSHRLWQRRFSGERSVIGATLNVDGYPVTVVGVMPPDFEFVTAVDLWGPMVPGEGFASIRRFHNWMVIARLRPGVSVSEAQSEVDVVMRRLAEAFPDSNRDKGMVVMSLQEAMVEQLRPGLLMLMGAIVLVLLIACGNVASLVLARGSARRTEMAVRSAMGAARGRLVRQLLTESAVIALGAGALGSFVAVSLQRSLVATTPLTRMGIEAARLQPEVLVFALALTLSTVVVFGLAPALSSARVDLAEELKSGARGVAGVRTRFRSGLVVAQVALSVVLLVGAGLLMRSFVRLQGVDPGFNPENVLTAEIGLPATKYADSELRIQFFQELGERARALPGVQGVGMISQLPIRDPGNNIGAWDPGDPPADASQVRLAYQRTVMPGYFQAMEIPTVAGRDVRASDHGGTPPVIVINEIMARTLFPDQNPLGRQVAVDRGGDEPMLFEVVGVVGDVQVSSLAADDLHMVMYFPYGQRPQRTMRMAVRTAGSPSTLIGPLRATLAEMDRDIPFAGAASMEEVLSRSVSLTRTIMGALGAFAIVALFLAALGLYGVLAYYVARRRHEIGIRVALGADAGDLIRMVLRRGFAMVLLGIALGVAGALGAGRFLQELLFQVEATDASTFAGVILFFGTVAALACLIPAWRAWRVDPVEAFRSE